MLTPEQLQVRTELTRAVAELGHAPSNADLAERAGLPVPVVEAALHALHEAHALLLHPGKTEPWAVHPFALSPGSCWVETGDKGYWANCVYCGFGIAAALDEDATIYTRIGGEREPVEIHVRNGELVERDLLFHLSTPPRAWWDNVIHACASFQPFRTEADVEDWCARHALPKGAVVPMPTMWAFARDWYGDAIRKPWRKRSADEVRTVFERHGFTSPFWSV
ncbi:Alkylmercury lyase [Sphingopyxis sp. LC81]|uniref:organomercurial lyase n=1 Tax=Sphingopyxis sp. LC81 TaxID=1502850 RepID=UPI00050FECA1|nr:organomercurial lyase [Sphingopyxis sp. LC81]KGB53065.1 Alkylmercury lyase [Sphingopyxis sp. LC81]